MRLTRMFGDRQEEFREIMKGLNAVPRKFGDIVMEDCERFRFGYPHEK
ncbi:MAG TPA: hypothetical protein IAA05_02605 [Candidatus Blautia excrementipullorum]|nr:hypothetical protein [Candidatus Blautia excrementipullorum]